MVLPASSCDYRPAGRSAAARTPRDRAVFGRWSGCGPRDPTTIASTMVTVAGVVFSITIVALQLASSQFGPRLLRNFIPISATSRVRPSPRPLPIASSCSISVRGDPHGSCRVGIWIGCCSPSRVSGADLFHSPHRASISRAVVQNVAADLERRSNSPFPEAIPEPPSRRATPSRRSQRRAADFRATSAMSSHRRPADGDRANRDLLLVLTIAPPTLSRSDAAAACLASAVPQAAASLADCFTLSTTPQQPRFVSQQLPNRAARAVSRINTLIRRSMHPSSTQFPRRVLPSPVALSFDACRLLRVVAPPTAAAARAPRSCHRPAADNHIVRRVTLSRYPPNPL